ncbi:MAG TPA: DUF58 domain-containing protein [Acidimicrobiia bacterium]|nr:DUF58 domain-containing protein [Acidimicrobiia bacterium]
MLTRRGWTLLGASLGLLVAGRLFGTVELAILAIAGFALLGLGAWWAKRQRVSVRASRTVRPARLHVGDQGRVDLALTNAGTRPTPVLGVTDTFEDGRRAARFLVAPVGVGQVARGAYRVPTTRRGRFTLGPLHVAVGDPFGVVRRALPPGPVDEVVVAPRVHRVVALGDAAGPPLGTSSQGASRLLPSDAGEEFLTLREYEVGDDLRRVHWRSTAHTDDLMVRQEEMQRRPEVTLLLDTRDHVHDDASFETAVEAIASIAAAMTRVGRRVDVLTSAGLRVASVSAGNLVLLMDQLAVIEPSEIDQLAKVTDGFRTRRPSGALVAVSGVTDDRVSEAIARAWSRFGTTVVVATRDTPNVRMTATRGRPSIVVVDASARPFPDAWNETITRWHLAAKPRLSLSPS